MFELTRQRGWGQEKEIWLTFVLIRVSFCNFYLCFFILPGQIIVIGSSVGGMLGLLLLLCMALLVAKQRELSALKGEMLSWVFFF